jgi:hypothetical protein
MQLQLESARGPGGETPVLAVAAAENALRLHKDDMLVLTRQGPGKPARLDAEGRVVRPTPGGSA